MHVYDDFPKRLVSGLFVIFATKWRIIFAITPSRIGRHGIPSVLTMPPVGGAKSTATLNIMYYIVLTLVTNLFFHETTIT